MDSLTFHFYIHIRISDSYRTSQTSAQSIKEALFYTPIMLWWTCVGKRNGYVYIMMW